MYIVFGILIAVILLMAIVILNLETKLQRLGDKVSSNSDYLQGLSKELFSQGEKIFVLTQYMNLKFKKVGINLYIEKIKEDDLSVPVNDLHTMEIENLRKQFYALLEYLKLIVWYTPAKTEIRKATKQMLGERNRGCCRG